jgi:flagellar biogenesis protein FliO
MDWIRELLALGFVACLLLALIWISRKNSALSAFSGMLGSKSRKNLMARLALGDRLVLTPSTSLHLVHADQRLFLISVHNAGVLLLSEMSLPLTREATGNNNPADNMSESKE